MRRMWLLGLRGSPLARSSYPTFWNKKWDRSVPGYVVVPHNCGLLLLRTHWVRSGLNCTFYVKSYAKLTRKKVKIRFLNKIYYRFTPVGFDKCCWEMMPLIGFIISQADCWFCEGEFWLIKSLRIYWLLSWLTLYGWSFQQKSSHIILLLILVEINSMCNWLYPPQVWVFSHHIAYRIVHRWCCDKRVRRFVPPSILLFAVAWVHQ